MIRARIVTSLVIGIILGVVIGAGIAVKAAWKDPTQAPPNGGGFWVRASIDPGCTLAADIGKLWFEDTTNDKLKVCANDGGLGWKNLH